MPEFDFWFSIGSTYSFPDRHAIGRTGAWKTVPRFCWRPFNVRTVMSAATEYSVCGKTGVKSAYMWRDIERRAAKYGHPCKPACAHIRYRTCRLQIRLRCWGCAKDGAKTLLKTLYRIWFEDGIEAGSETALSEALA